METGSDPRMMSEPTSVIEGTGPQVSHTLFFGTSEKRTRPTESVLETDVLTIGGGAIIIWVTRIPGFGPNKTSENDTSHTEGTPSRYFVIVKRETSEEFLRPTCLHLIFRIAIQKPEVL